MPNPKKAVQIHLGGKFHYLRYDFNALVALEEALGVPISRWQDIINEQMGVRTIRTLVWAGLIHEDSNITPKDVGAMLDVSKFNDTISKVLEAFTLAFSSDQRQEKKEQGKADEAGKDGTGTTT